MHGHPPCRSRGPQRAADIPAASHPSPRVANVLPPVRDCRCGKQLWVLVPSAPACCRAHSAAAAPNRAHHSPATRPAVLLPRPVPFTRLSDCRARPSISLAPSPAAVPERIGTHWRWLPNYHADTHVATSRRNALLSSLAVGAAVVPSHSTSPHTRTPTNPIFNPARRPIPHACMT